MDAKIERLIVALEQKAEASAKALKIMADMKTARQTDREDHPELSGQGYSSPTIEQTIEWQAAQALRGLADLTGDAVVERSALAYLEAEARRFADCYSQASDGRNTFVIFADKIAALRSTGSAEGEEMVERQYRHKKRGTVYTMIGVGKAQGTLNDEDPVVLYRGEDGGLWVRHQVEFSDGRFEKVAAISRG